MICIINSSFTSGSNGKATCFVFYLRSKNILFKKKIFLELDILVPNEKVLSPGSRMGYRNRSPLWVIGKGPQAWT